MVLKQDYFKGEMETTMNYEMVLSLMVAVK